MSDQDNHTTHFDSCGCEAKRVEKETLARVNEFINFEIEGFPLSDYSRLISEFARAFRKEFLK